MGFGIDGCGELGGGLGGDGGRQLVFGLRVDFEGWLFGWRIGATGYCELLDGLAAVH